jgi:hypothetical protein
MYMIDVAHTRISTESTRTKNDVILIVLDSIEHVQHCFETKDRILTYIIQRLTRSNLNRIQLRFDRYTEKNI